MQHATRNMQHKYKACPTPTQDINLYSTGNYLVINFATFSSCSDVANLWSKKLEIQLGNEG